MLDIPGAYRRYCKIASVVFLLFTVYPVVTKLLDHRLAHDWLHSALHLASALLAAYAGWAGRPAIARLYVREIGSSFSSSWTVLDGLPSQVIVPVATSDGAQHLVAVAENLFYISADAQRNWSSWSEIPSPPSLAGYFDGELVETAGGGVGLVWTTDSQQLWEWACETAPCAAPSAWGEPVLLSTSSMRAPVAALGFGGRIDVVQAMDEERLFPPFIRGLWHKRWEAPR